MHISHEFSSQNYDRRPMGSSIEFIVLHYTEMIFENAIAKLCDQAAKVSCHYLVKESGEIFQLVEDEMRAWHAGTSAWGGKVALNDYSIGIEIDNLGNHPFTEQQMVSCIELCKFLVDKHKIKPWNIIGHSDIAPSRKLDPGLYFDWNRLAAANLGMFPKKYVELDSLEESPQITQAESVALLQMNLAKLGYNVKPTGLFDAQTNCVIRAFQAHFCQANLLMRGMNLYRDLDSQYCWDAESQQKLDALLNK